MDIMTFLKSEAEQVEVLEMQNESTTVEFEANRLKTSRVEETSGTAVRVVRHGRLGFAASSDAEAVNKLAANALESASYGDKIPLTFAGNMPAPAVKTFDAAVAEMPIPRLVEIGQQSIEMILAVEPNARINLTLERGVQKAGLRTHAGADIAFERSPFSIGLELSRIEGDDVLILFDMLGMTTLTDDPLTPARNMVSKLERCKTLTSIRSGNMPVIFSPSGSLAMFIPLMEGLDGKNVYKGISPIAQKVGEKLFDDKPFP